jgi:hypothetical protein
MEEQYRIMAAEKKVELLVFNRGLIDGSVYMPGARNRVLLIVFHRSPKNISVQ